MPSGGWICASHMSLPRGMANQDTPQTHYKYMNPKVWWYPNLFESNQCKSTGEFEKPARHVFY